MMDKSHILLVEGTNDERFFKMLLKKNSLEKVVTACPPKNIGGSYNGKQGVITFLPSILMQLNDGSLKKLGLVVDCDTDQDGGGLQRTLSQISEKLESYNYEKTATALQTGGFVFKNTDGLPDVGVWIMPDNKNEGALEDWISQLTSSNQTALFKHASETVDKLPTPLFSTTKKIKSQVATWLAWQDRPGEGLYYTIEGNLLDESKPLYSDFLKWINNVLVK
jgi:hypothetical protein